MLIYEDIISGDELLSSAFDVKEVDDTVYEVDCAMINVASGADVDIGANPSAEGGDEATDDGVERVNNVIYNARLQSTSFDKKSYILYLKGYLKSVKKHLVEQGATEEDIAKFEKNAQEFAKKIAKNFNNYEFYVGESMNPEGMVVLLDYREDGITPYCVFWKAGLKTLKV